MIVNPDVTDVYNSWNNRKLP